MSYDLYILRRISNYEKPSSVTLCGTTASQGYRVSESSIANSAEAYSIGSTTQQEDVHAAPSIEENRSGDPDAPPDGGLFAWLQVFAGWILVMNSRGMTNMFGTFQAYYTDTLLRGTSPSDISWIGSLQTFTLMFVGVLSARLMDAGYLRTQLYAGVFLEVFGMMISSISSTYWQILVFQGLCGGLGAGLLYLPSIVVPSQYFSSQTMFASGIITTGSSMVWLTLSGILTIAGVIYPILIRKLLSTVKYHWAMRCLALIILVTNGLSLMILRPRAKTILRSSSSKRAMLWDPPYALFVLAMTFLFTSLYVPYFYLEDYARSQNVRAPLVNYVLSIANAASFLGRIVPNLLANRNRIDSLVITGIYCLISGATVFFWLLAHGQTWTIVFASVYGFVSGGLVSLPPATLIALSKTANEYGNRMGLAFTICSLGALIGNPIAGALIGIGQQSGHPFFGPWIFAGGTMVLAALFTVAAYYAHQMAIENTDSSSDFGGLRESSPKPKRLRSLLNEVLTMRSTAAFAL